MNTNKTFGYVRISPRHPNQQAEIDAMIDRFPEVDMREERKVKGYVPAAERPVLQSVLSELKAGDQIVVWWINVLGCHFADVKETIEYVLEKGAFVTTINKAITFTASNPETRAQIALLEGIAIAEKKRRLAFAEASREALRENPEEWAKRYRGRQANKELHHRIATLLLEGKTLQATADETGSSLSTVKRVKSKIMHKATQSDMRTKKPE